MTRSSYCYNCNPDTWFATGYEKACAWAGTVGLGGDFVLLGVIYGDYTMRRSPGTQTHTNTLPLLLGCLVWVLNRSLRTYTHEDTFCFN